MLFLDKMIQGLYCITNKEISRKDEVQVVRELLEGGCRVVQYREKGRTKEERIETAMMMKEIVKSYDATFIVNDYVEVAKKVGADGVHLGQKDLKICSYEEARRQLGDGKIIGITVHNVEEAVEAEKLGADYLGVAPIFATTTKKDAGPPAGVQLIRDIKAKVSIPLVAIGGITLENLETVIKAGADSVAVISGVLASDDIKKEVKKFNERIKKAYQDIGYRR